MRQIAKTVLLRLTAQEYAHLQETSKIAGLKIEPMIRKLIMGEKLRPQDRKSTRLNSSHTS